MCVSFGKYLLVFLMIMKSVLAAKESVKNSEIATPYIGNFSTTPKANMKDVHVFTYNFITYYVFRNKKLNWYDAFTYCRSIGMFLVSPSTKDISVNLINTLKDKSLLDDYWISATNLGSRKTWVWMSTGKPMIYSQWLSGEPSNSFSQIEQERERCVEIRSTAWTDHICSRKKYFICEK